MSTASYFYLIGFALLVISAVSIVVKSRRLLNANPDGDPPFRRESLLEENHKGILLALLGLALVVGGVISSVLNAFLG